MKVTQPNILLIMTDQQRYDYLSVNGGKCKTLALERLASEGMNFSNAYTVCSLCTPARASIFTGLYPHKHGLWNNCDMFSPVRENLPDDVTILSHELAEAGYICGYSGKWHIDKKYSALDRGFEGFSLPGYGNPRECKAYDDYLEKNNFSKPVPTPFFKSGNSPVGYVLDCEIEATVEYFQTNIALDLMRNFSKSKHPFFLSLQYWGPHEPVRVTSRYSNMYSAAETPLVGSFHDDLEKRPAQYKRHRNELESWYQGISKINEKCWKKITSKYYAYTTMIDDQVSRVLEELDNLGLTDNTVVIYTSDHGNLCGARGGLYDKGVGMFEDTYRIPFIIRYPNETIPGSTNDNLISNMDIYSTVLDFAGLRDTKEIDSRSILPVIKNPDSKWRDDLMCWSSGAYYLHSQRMLRWKKYKYIFTPYDTDELYDLETDPMEMCNLINETNMKDIKNEMRKRLIFNATMHSDPIKKLMDGYFHV